MTSFIPTHISTFKQKRAKPTHIINSSIYLTCETLPYISNKVTTNHGSKHIMSLNNITLLIKSMVSILCIYIKRGLNKLHAYSYECMTYLIYLATPQHLWHHEWACECMFMASKQKTSIKP